MIQRAAYKRGKLSQDRIDKLNSVGFSWSANSDEKWNENFKEFKSHIQSKSHLQSEGRAKRLFTTSEQSAMGVPVWMPVGAGKTVQRIKYNEWVRKQPKDAKEKKEQRQFELFQQFLKWKEENE